MIRVGIVDDQRLMREGLRTLINLEQDLKVEWLAANGKEAVSAMERAMVEVVLMDIRMPVQNGITATKTIKERWPETKVLMLTTYEDKEDVVGALSAGAVGYLLKDMPAEDIANAIRTAYKGGAVLPPGVAHTFLNAVFTGVEKNPMENPETGIQEAALPTVKYPSGDASQPAATASHVSEESSHGKETLTDREVDVLNCLAEGLSNREIAQKLFVTEGTVKNHVSSLIAKLDLRDRTQAALYAVRHGFGDYANPSS